MPIYICAILLMIAADQAVKYWAFTSLQAQQTIPLINGVFHLTYIENRGAAFSLFAQFDSRWIFVVLAIVITVAIFTAIYKNMLQTQLGCWSLIHFPVFNVADIFICAGGVLFVLYFMFQHKETSGAEK